MRRHARMGLLAVAAAALLACDEDPGPRTPAYLVVTPNLPRIPLGGTQQLSVTVVDADGREVEGEPVTFQSSDPERITVDESGLLTSVWDLGTSIITATSGDLTAEVEARVVVGPSSLYASPAFLNLIQGEGGQINVIVTDEHGDSIPDAEVLFQTDRPSVAQVHPDGFVVGGDLGGAVITVTSGDHSSFVTVGVGLP